MLDSSGDAYALIEGDSSDQGSIRFRADPQGAGSNTHIRFDTDGTQRVRIDSNGLGISSTTTTARNAGVGTAIGTIIFNSTDNKLQVYANRPVALIWAFNNALVYEKINNLKGIFYYGGREVRDGSTYDQEMLIKVLIKNLIRIEENN